jgi:hypothetical protein
MLDRYFNFYYSNIHLLRTNFAYFIVFLTAYFYY